MRNFMNQPANERKVPVKKSMALLDEWSDIGRLIEVRT